MSPTVIRVARLAVAPGAALILFLALLQAVGILPRVPIAGELIGLTAAALAPGLAVESVLHGPRWTLLERFGYAAALSFALDGLAGVGLHLSGIPVSPSHILVVTLAVATCGAGATIVLTSHDRVGPDRPRLPAEAALGIVAVVMLAVGVVLIIVVKPAPPTPSLEIMAVDGSARLLAMPLVVRPGGTSVTIQVRSPSGSADTVTLSVAGDGVAPWSSSPLPVTTAWTTAEIPLEVDRVGPITATIRASSAAIDLSLPIAMEVGP